MIKKNDPGLFLNRINFINIQGRLYEHHEYQTAVFIPGEISFRDGIKDEKFALIEKRHILLRALKLHTVTELFNKEEFVLLKVYLLSLNQLCDDYLNHHDIKVFADNIDEMAAQYFNGDELINININYGKTFTVDLTNDIINPFKKYLSSLIDNISSTSNLMIARKVISEFTKIYPTTKLSRQPKAQYSYVLVLDRQKDKLPKLYQYLIQEDWINDSCTSQDFMDAFLDNQVQKKIIWKKKIINLKIFLTCLFDNRFIHKYDGHWATSNNIFCIEGKTNLTQSLTDARGLPQSYKLKALITFTKDLIKQPD